MQSNDINVMIFWACVVIGAIVYAAIIWSLIAYRKSKSQENTFHKNVLTEIAWTVVPLLIIIAMTIPAAKLLSQIYNSENNSEEGMRIEFKEAEKGSMQLANRSINLFHKNSAFHHVGSIC